MKVAILTQPLGRNYGGLLQAYALQKYLRDLGCDVQTIDRRPANHGHIPAKSYILNIIRLMLGRIKSVPTTKRQEAVFANLAAFRDQRVELSDTLTSENEIRDYFSGHHFDALVVGSDQVWRPRYSPSILNFYLDFLDDTDHSPRRLAYAASFGVDEWEYPENITARCAKLAQRFDAVSVREESAVDLCRDRLGVSAAWVVDPTLLLEPSDYDRLISEECEGSNPSGVLSYVLDPAPEKRSIGMTVANTLGTEVFSIKPELSIAQVRASEHDQCHLPTVEAWLKAFRDASFVVTDSFHGTVFSILFNKPFIVVGNSSRGMARFDSILSQFGLSERLVLKGELVTQELILSAIDWGCVNDKRAALAEEGKAFLRFHLLGE